MNAVEPPPPPGPLATTTHRPNPDSLPSSRPASPVSFWSRNKILINFWLDVTLTCMFLVMAWMMIVVQYVFPRGVRIWTIWGATAEDWRDGLFGVFCAFSLGIVVHVMLHWDWICATVATRLLHRKAQRDDGSQTLIGVGVLVVVIHLIIAGVLAARVSLTSSA